MHPEDDDDEDPKEDPVDYHADGGDDGDDEDESSEDEEDDEMDVEADEEEEEEEEHLAPADSIVVAPTAADQASSVEETEPFETDEDEAASTSHSPQLQLPSASHREDRPEVTLPPRKRKQIRLKRDKSEQKRTKPDKKGKRVEAGKNLKQLQWVEEKKLSKTQKEWPKMQIPVKNYSSYKKGKRQGPKLQIFQSYKDKGQNCKLPKVVVYRDDLCK
nr:hypothetical protein [Tanacetum cinerariifolium]